MFPNSRGISASSKMIAIASALRSIVAAQFVTTVGAKLRLRRVEVRRALVALQAVPLLAEVATRPPPR